MGCVTRILLLLGSVALSAQEQVVRITVNLLQVDAVVVDKKGIPVTNLKADDFEILQDGKKQKISSFQFVDAEPATKRPIQLLTHGSPKPGEMLRTIAIVVDDIGQIHASLRNSWMSESGRDLVTIVRTSAGIGAQQSFTTIRRLMYAAIDRVRWNSLSMVLSPFHFSEGDPRRTADDPDEFREQVYSAGNLGAVN